jgi:transposase
MVRNEGKTQQEVAERFQISVSSLKRWLRRENLAPDKPGPTDARTLDRQRLQEIVKSHPDRYLDEYAEMMGSKRSTIAYNLQVLKLSRKKNHALRGKKRG